MLLDSPDSKIALINFHPLTQLVASLAFLMFSPCFSFPPSLDFLFPGNILQPSAPLSTNNNNGTSVCEKKQQAAIVGSTWSNVNIDLENLMGNKSSKGPAPTMNQLKSSANTSPVKSANNVMSPTTNTNFAFNQSNNNNNFNQFNAFQ